MPLASEETCSTPPLAAQEQAVVREQLERMLETNLFNQSRRYPALLRFIVDETLEGRGSLLKERLLGIEVFGRDPSYETATDPIVRVTTAEIRKRIAQYYHDEAHDAELRIELPSGHYVAEFRPGKTIPRPAPASGAPTHPVEPASVLKAPAGSDERPLRAPVMTLAAGRKIALWLALAAVIGVAVRLVYLWERPSALDQLWAPLLSSGKQISFCVPTDVGKHRGALTTPSDLLNSDGTGPQRSPTGSQVMTFLEHETTGENVVFSDMMATLKIADLIAVRGREIRVKLNVNTTLDDLRQGPAVLIGGLDNQWTMQSLAPLRFGFAGSDDGGYWISDARDPGNRSWSLNLKQQYTTVTRDYALVARIHNRETGYPQIIVAGIGMSGTEAAGEFLVDATQTEELRRQIGPSFRERDFEAVLSTDVVNGIAGAPRIVGLWVR